MVELVIAWGWEEYGQQFRMWGKPIFGENQFWLLGQVITQKCMPFGPFTHVLHLLTQRSLGSCLLPWFCLMYIFHSWIGALGSFTITIHPRWVAVCVFLPHVDNRSSLSWLRILFWVTNCGWVSSPTFLWHSPPFSKLRNRCGLIFWNLGLLWISVESFWPR